MSQILQIIFTWCENLPSFLTALPFFCFLSFSHCFVVELAVISQPLKIIRMSYFFFPRLSFSLSPTSHHCSGHKVICVLFLIPPYDPTT